MLPLVPFTVEGSLLAAGAVAFNQQRAARPRLAALLDGRTVPALVQAPLSRQPSPPTGLAATLRAGANALDDRYQAFMHHHFDRLFGAEREQQMQEISAVGGGLVITPYEKNLEPRHCPGRRQSSSRGRRHLSAIGPVHVMGDLSPAAPWI